MENSMKVAQKTKNRTPHPEIPLLGIYPKKMKALFWKDICTPVFIAALFTVAKIWKQLKCTSIDEWIKKMWYILIYTMDYYSAIKKNEILPFLELGSILY